MDCIESNDEVLFYAAGALTEMEADQVRRHLASGCPRCAGELAEAQATLSLLTMTLPPATPSDNVRHRLLKRLSTEARSINRSVTIPRQTESIALAGGIPWWAQLAVPSAIAAGVAAAITIFFSIRMQSRSSQATSGLEQTVSALSAIVAQDQQQLAVFRANRPNDQVQTVQWASNPDLKMLWMTGTPEQPAGARGRVFWDADKGVWHFFASGLKPAPAGKTYELWFVSSDGKVAMPAGSFNPTADGQASLETNVPPSMAATVKIAAVTDEPAAGSSTPTGTFQLKGSLN